MSRFLALALIFLIFFARSSGQDFSNKGRDFWVGYGSHVAMYNGSGSVNSSGGTQNMVLYFTSDQSANVKVEIPATGWVRTYTVTANNVTETEIIPKTGTDDARLGTEGVSDKGIHITSDRPVVAYAHIYDGSVSGASLLFPTNTLGQDYYVLGYTQSSNSNYSYPFCFVIATEDSTVVEITPSANTLNHPAGTTFTQTLQKGQIFNLLGQLTGMNGSSYTGVDLTGTRIRSISSGTNGCKKIAVFCGSGKLNIKCSSTGTATADNTIQQCFPSNAWGKKYITVPTRDMPNNYFRIMVNNTGTKVKLNGTILTNLTANRYYEFQSNTPNIIEADQPVMLAQFITTANQCGNTTLGTNGDPEMIYLSPVEQTINKITLNSTTHAAINANYHYINVVMKTAGVKSFTIDGTSLSGSFLTLPSDPTYSYIQYKTTAGIHNLIADSGFNAIAYGYGSAESYGYNAGTNVIDQYQYVTLQNQYATINFPATCTNTPFHYAITLPYKATSLTWDFNNNPNQSPNAAVVNNSPVLDSSFVKDGKTLYVYSLPGGYSFNTVGTYQVKVIANNPTADGCSGTQEIIYDVVVYYPPTVDFNITNSGCLSDTGKFSDVTNATPRTVYKWKWDFGDNTVDSVKSPLKKYNASGTFNVKLQAITDVGCIAEAVKPVTIASMPNAYFKVSGFQCINRAVTFTDSSTVADGNIVKWYWNFGNGDSLVATTNNPQTKTYSATGSYVVTLQVETAIGCRSTVFSKQVDVHQVPVVNFIIPQVCLSDATAQFTDSSYIADSTINLATYLWKFGDANAAANNPDTSIIRNGAHKYLSTGVYNVSLTVTSNNGCATTTTKQFTLNGAEPKSDFTVLNNSALCSNTTVQIQNSSSVNFGSITKVEIVWDAGNAPSTIITDSFPTANKIYSHNYPALQTTTSYQIKLRAYSGISCVDQSVKTITVNASPKTSFSTIPGICLDATARQLTQASGGGVSGTGIFSGNGVSSSGLFTPSGAGVGTQKVHYVYTSDKGCVDSANQTITVWPSPTVKWGYSSPTCINGAITFTDSSVANYSNITQWKWNFGDGTSAIYNNKNPFGRSYNATNSYNVALQVKTDSGCQSTVSTKTIIVHPLPTVDFSLPNICLPSGKGQFNDLTTISDGTQSSFTYSWNFGDPIDATASTQKNPIHKYSTSGPFAVQLKVTSVDGCVDSAKKQLVNVYPQPKADFIVSPTDTCLGATFYFTDKSNGVTGSITNWSWDFGDGTKSILQNPSRKYVRAQAFNVSLFITNQQGCVSDTAIKTVTVNSYPVVNAGPDLFVLEGGNTTINATAAGTSLTYRWTPATYLNYDTILKPLCTPLDDITYRLTVTGRGGCTNYDDVFVKLLKAPVIPNAFSPNGDGINDVWNIKYLETYPDCIVEVFNRYGQPVFSSKGYSKPWDGTINGSPLSEGVYYYVINPKNGRKPYTGSITILR
jgi:gliding motility-associated-like protein